MFFSIFTVLEYYLLQNATNQFYSVNDSVLFERKNETLEVKILKIFLLL